MLTNIKDLAMDPDRIVPPKELGEWLSVSERTVREYQALGLIEAIDLPREGKMGRGAPRKGYRLQASIRAVTVHLRSRSAGWTAEGSDGETLSPAAESAALNRARRALTEQQTRKAAVQAEIAETELRVVQGQLLDIEAVVRAWSMIITSTKGRFLGLPSRLPTVIHGLSRQDVAVIQDEVRDILEKLAADGASVIADVTREAAKRIAAADKNNPTQKGTTDDDEAPARE
jgi:phage terminase Nu1 subunit (DNA packaging protein)